jgi:hypothetical protein
MDGAGAAALETHQKVLLPDAIELDDAPVFERFFFVSSGSPPDAAAILNEARDLAARPDRGLSRLRLHDLELGQRGGPQHPNYNIQMSGTGDVVIGTHER